MPSSDTAYQLSVRSIVVGGLVGSVVTAANIWVGLKTGWAISPSLFAAILGFFLVRTTLDLVLKYSPSCVREGRGRSRERACVVGVVAHESRCVAAGS